MILLRCYSNEQLKGGEIHKYRVVTEKVEWNRQLGGLSVDGRLILKWVLNKYDRTLCIELICLRTGTNDMLFLTL